MCENLDNTGVPISYSAARRSALLVDPTVRTEQYLIETVSWTVANPKSCRCRLIGCELEDDSHGPIGQLTAELRQQLRTPRTVAVNPNDLADLGLNGPAGQGRINNQVVTVVGGFTGIPGGDKAPLIFCSVETARLLIRPSGPEDSVTFVLASSGDPEALLNGLGANPAYRAFSRSDLSWQTRKDVARKRPAAVVIGLILLVWATIVTAITLHDANRAWLWERHWAGRPNPSRARRFGRSLRWSLAVACTALLVALPAAFLLKWAAQALGLYVVLGSGRLWLGTIALTLVTTTVAGITAGVRAMWLAATEPQTGG
jgi:hypothetical protein